MPKRHIAIRKGRIEEGAQVHQTAQVWDLAHIRAHASVGQETIVGRCVYVGPGVIIGAQCKIQNNAQLFEPAVIEDGVFVGPGAILTNDRYPRAITPDAKLKSADDWNPVRVHVEFGASIGAGAICVAPIRIGKWSMIAAGSVVTTDVQPFQLVAGIPARAVGWVGPAGLQLSKISENEYQCPQTSQRFQLRNGIGMEPLE